MLIYFCDVQHHLDISCEFGGNTGTHPHPLQGGLGPASFRGWIWGGGQSPGVSRPDEGGVPCLAPFESAWHLQAVVRVRYTF